MTTRKKPPQKEEELAALADLLEAVRQKHGALTAPAVVTEARAPGSPLHEKFSWDEHENSEKYLLVQARRLIKRCKVRYIDQQGDLRQIRAYHIIRSSPPTADGSRDYQPVEDIVTDPLRQKLLARQMEREWKQFRTRWHKLAEFTEFMTSELEKLETG